MFNFKFEKSKYPIYSIAFITIIFFALYGIFNIIRTYHLNFNIKNRISAISPITINISSKEQIRKLVFACYDDFCSQIEGNPLSNVYTSSFNQSSKNISKIKNVYIAYPFEYKVFEKDLIGIDLYTGNKRTYISNNDFKKIQSKNIEIEIQGKKEKFKLFQISDKSNYNGFSTDIKTSILSLVHNWQYFILPYFWIFVAILIYIFKKNEIKLNMPKFIPKCLLVFLSMLIAALFLLEICVVSIGEKEGINDFIFLIKKEIQNYKNYEIHIFTDNKINPKDYPEFKNIKWHIIDTEKNGVVEHIKKYDYIDKNKKSIIYINSFTGNLDKIMLGNLKSDRFYSNNIETLRITHIPKGE